MAVDDITTIMAANLAGTGTVSRQPAGGVEEMLLDLGTADNEGPAPNGCPAARVVRIDGTNNQAQMMRGDNGEMGHLWFQNIKMVADNTNYFQIQQMGTTGDLTFSVIVVG